VNSDPEMPLVTVVIPSYNTAATIGRTIESIASTGYTPLQLIIVDDGSRDNSLAVIAEYAGKFPWIECLTHPGGVNRGIAATRNLAIQHARGKYVAFVDADDTFLPNRFQTCIPMMEQDGSINVIYEPYKLIHVSGSRSDEMRSGQSEELVHCDSDDELFFEVLKTGGLPHTTSVTVRRDALIDTDLFPPLKYCLEKPLWLKLYSRGGVRPGGSAPVACYFLHDGSTCAKHEDSRAFRFEDVTAYSNVYRWMKKRRIKPTMASAVAKKAMGKYLHYTTYARSLRGDFTRDILMAPIHFLSDYPGAALSKSFWWGSLRMILGLTRTGN
jgi:glycosyltransferase involved in cell wall biosynthesis